MRSALILAVALLVAANPSVSQGQAAQNESSWLQLEYARSSKDSDGHSSGSANGRQALIETVIEETSEGVVLEYDLPRDEADKSKSGFWYFPAQVRERPDGSLELLNVEAAEIRIDQWLKKYDIPREACGLWSHGGGFPFKVDCDPQSILSQIEPFDLRLPNLAAGNEYAHASGDAPGILATLPAPRSGYSVTVSIDQSKAQADEAKNALILAQMMGDDLSPAQAEDNSAKIGHQGAITIEFDLDASGQVVRKTERVEVTVTRPGEKPETKTSVITVTRLDMETARAKFRD